MLCPDFERIDRDTIEYYLQELEGDYYSFLDYSSVSLLKNYGLLNAIQADKIVALKEYISSIPANLWNKNSFEVDLKWQKVHDQACDILRSLNVKGNK
jgi:hypothetical protein